MRSPILALLALVLLPAAALAATPGMTAWDGKHPLAHTLGPFTLSAARAPADPDADDDPPMILKMTDAAGESAVLEAEIAFGDDVYATLGAGRIDPDSAKPQLLLTTYSGGAHCCVHIQLLDWQGGAWRKVDVGTFDGSPFTAFPTDLDGDGVADIRHWDDRFAYAFGCYACSWMPPRIFNVRRGKVIDVSAAPRYRKLFEADYARARDLCLMHANAACAGMVADGVRLGRAQEAWTLAMANLDLEDDWVLPGCKIREDKDRGCPKGQQYGIGDFRPVLTRFLTHNGYASTGR